MPKFYNLERPILTVMINRPKDYDDVISRIRKGLENGAEAFGFCMEGLDSKFRTREYLTKIFDAMDSRPAYLTDYRRGNVNPDLSDDELAEELLLALDCGAGLIDIWGDMFSESPIEITKDEAAIEKQTKLADTIHKMGGEVLISSHTHHYMTPEEVLEIARLQEARHADIAKIVTNADTEKELKDNFDILFMLKENIKIDTLFLCNGDNCRLHRLFGPMIAGSSLFLCTNEHEVGNNQPTIETARKIINMQEVKK